MAATRPWSLSQGATGGIVKCLTRRPVRPTKKGFLAKAKQSSRYTGNTTTPFRLNFEECLGGSVEGLLML